MGILIINVSSILSNLDVGKVCRYLNFKFVILYYFFDYIVNNSRVGMYLFLNVYSLELGLCNKCSVG